MEQRSLLPLVLLHRHRMEPYVAPTSGRGGDLTSAFTVFLLAVLISPYYFPVTADTFNWAPVLLGAVTIFGFISYWIVPEDRWLANRRLKVIAENEVHRKGN